MESVINQWAAMSVEEQLKMLSACVKKAARREVGRSNDGGYLQFVEDISRFFVYHGIDSLVNEAWCKLTERLTPEYLDGLNKRRMATGKAPITLISLAFRAARDAIRVCYAADMKHGGPARVEGETTMDDGETADVLETLAADDCNTEEDVVYKMTMEDFIRKCDEIDRVIINGLFAGKQQREIAANLGITAQAVNYRVKKIRKRLIDAGIVKGMAATA